MCAQFIIKASFRDLARTFGVPDTSEEIEFRERILPHSLAPVLVADQGELHLKAMKFSLLPSWSRESKVKFATHNARIETVAEKATWKGPFLKSHCIVPMTSFIEPIYEGELAGNMVAFESSEIMAAAGIFDSWVNRETGEVIESFAIITSEPSDFVRGVGHDRQPVFLNLSSSVAWTRLAGPAPELLKFLQSQANEPHLVTVVDRPLKPGWEKRK